MTVCLIHFAAIFFVQWGRLCSWLSSGSSLG